MNAFSAIVFLGLVAAAVATYAVAPAAYSGYGSYYGGAVPALSYGSYGYNRPLYSGAYGYGAGYGLGYGSGYGSGYGLLNSGYGYSSPLYSGAYGYGSGLLNGAYGGYGSGYGYGGYGLLKK